MLNNLPMDPNVQRFSPDEQMFMTYQHPRPMYNAYSNLAQQQIQSPKPSMWTWCKHVLVRVGIFYILAWLAWIVCNSLQPYVEQFMSSSLTFLPIKLRVGIIISTMLFVLFMLVTEMYHRWCKC